MPTTQQDINENKVIAAIGYLGILCFIPLLGKKDSPYAQHHGKQSFVVLITWILLWIGNIIPLIGQIIWFIGSIGLLYLVVMGIVNALQGNMWEMPVLGRFKSQVKL